MNYHHQKSYEELITERKRVGIEYTRACNLFMPLEVTNPLVERHQRIFKITNKMERQATKQYLHEVEMAQTISRLVVDGEIFE